MASFDEYAALARQLHELQRSEERTAALAAQQRDAVVTGADRLGQRLVLQRQRLEQIAQAIGEQLSPPPDTGPQAAGPGYPVMPGQPALPVPGPPGQLVPGQPALPVAGQHPVLPAGPTRLALSADPARPPHSQQPAAAGPVPAPRPAPVDPVRALDLARQAADTADAVASRVETLAQRPPLLPGWSPVARAITVYGGFALIAVIMGVILFQQIDKRDLGSWFTAIAWSGAGLPAVAFFSGYLVLNAWGKPRIVVGQQPSGYLRLGFLICFLVVPAAACVFGAFPVLAEGPGG
ncbi:hypothetical protein GCM10027290_16670 [Micromonospora sonneratiae]|uniref:Uncharacterized protein n=1 Tax=Micromonospora sonneratiae TaxID=1184706 RepID=A0ABW3YCJ9_9ACTN